MEKWNNPTPARSSNHRYKTVHTTSRVIKPNNPDKGSGYGEVQDYWKRSNRQEWYDDPYYCLNWIIILFLIMLIGGLCIFREEKEYKSYKDNTRYEKTESTNTNSSANNSNGQATYKGYSTGRGLGQRDGRGIGRLRGE